MHFLSFTDISMVIYHYGTIAARGSEGVKKSYFLALFKSKCRYVTISGICTVVMKSEQGKVLEYDFKAWF